MKAGVKFLVVLVLAMGVLGSASGQITVTSTDVNNVFGVGKTLWTSTDNSTVLLNIGNLGGGNTWDFSSLHAASTSAMTVVAPGTTPYAIEFPGASYALKIDTTIQGIPMSLYQYFVISTNLLDPGRKGGVSITGGGSITLSTRNSPAAVYFALPSTYQTSWTSVFVERDTTSIDFPPFFSSVTDTTINHKDSSSIDAHGTMKLPGGLVLNALRIRQVLRDPGLFVEYVFLAKEGVIVTVEAGDTLSRTGTIPVIGVSWLSAIAVGVPEEKFSPSEFVLHQNFPNPFNPSTVIRYQVPATTPVKLVVYDLLGREVEVLIDETKTPGEYTATFDAKGLSSGVYLYRLEAGNFVQTRRMLLVK
jgi:hypothetical protein